MQSLKLKIEGPLALLELDHGKANEMGSEQLRDFEELCVLAESGEIRALLTWSQRKSAKGAPIFISGANVTERSGWSEDRIKEHVRWQRTLLNRLRHAPIFHIAIVNGVAFGWGTEYLLTCDYRIACPEAKLGLPETGLGILPGAGGSAELWALVGVGQALRLGMTGELIGAEEAVRIGLVQELQPNQEAAMSRARALVDMVSRRSPTAVAAYKGAVLAAVGRDPAERQSLEACAYEHCVDTGEAARGRANFDAILKGGSPEWGPLRRWSP